MGLTVAKTIAAAFIFTCFLNSIDCRKCKDKFKAVPGHTACLPRSQDHQSGTGLEEEDQKRVVELHNIYRAQVTNAKNMQEMVWDEELAMVAQAWAENCEFKHDKERDIPGRFSVGQNLASGHLNWEQSIKAWVDERIKFSYNSDAMDLKDVGHFTQLAWASSAKLGCGYAQCRGISKFYVCNYGPGGNIGDIKTPFQQGTQGAACPSKKNARGLCDCQGKVCLNGGDLDLDSCTCRCNKRVNFYKPETNCSLDCEVAEDPDFCLDNYGYQACHEYDNVPYECPFMCRVCPWAGVNYAEGSVPVPGAGHVTKMSFALTALLLFVISTLSR